MNGHCASAAGAAARSRKHQGLGRLPDCQGSRRQGLGRLPDVTADTPGSISEKAAAMPGPTAEEPSSPAEDVAPRLSSGSSNSKSMISSIVGRLGWRGAGRRTQSRLEAFAAGSIAARRWGGSKKFASCIRAKSDPDQQSPTWV